MRAFLFYCVEYSPETPIAQAFFTATFDMPAITNVSGIYGPQTEAAVRAFQSIRELGNTNPNGIVDRATWYRMSFIYSAVKRLGELTSEGIIIGIGRTPPTEIIREGSRGRLVQQAQYLLNFISERCC
ncbi:MAG: peptidoglycan-binding protein [Defluviitaleaceae bacterium]|nr:peptidoglycan-binding protein [Defluviitaleaceae bacterium]MCL2263583.1 peptidoglycan-binding protein [Defluviitaleaceae bacterium]